MADFSHLGTLEVSADTTTEYTLHQITVNSVSPTLIVAPATEANKPYFNALLKRAGKTARQVRANAINTGLIEENRLEDLELYPRHVIKGWQDVLDADGTEVDFSQANLVEFLDVLPNWLFDDLRNYCGNPANFSELVDVETSAKNSPSGSSGS